MSDQTIQFRRNNSRGIALAITLVVLVSLAVITTILALRVSQVSQRQQYIMDYQKARYGADSALKYIFSVLPETKTDYADRSDAADFSDLFWLNKPDYLKYLTAWAQTATPEQLEKYLKPSEDQDQSDTGSDSMFSTFLAKMTGSDSNDANDANEPNQLAEVGEFIDEIGRAHV